MRVAVVDLGKTNAKLALVETDDATERRVETRPTPLGDAPYPHLDTEAIAAFVEEGLTALAADGPVDAVSVATHGATVALVDAAGALALPVLDYEHAGVDETRDAYQAVRPPFAETGSPALPGGLNVGAQLFWLQRRFAERFARAVTLLTWPQYWVYRLCGARANDTTSLGCHTDLYAPASGVHSSLVERMGWTRLMPPVCRPGARLGTLDAALAARTGLSPRTPVHAGIHDSNASLVPHLLGRDGPVTVVSSGTWVIVMALGGHAVTLDERRDTLLNVDAFGEAVPSARFMGGRERALLSGRDGEGDGDEAVGAGDPATLERVLASGVMALPSRVPGSGPWPDAAFRWHGDEGSLSGAERDRAVALYLGLVSAECVALAGGAGPIVVEGPFAANVDYAHALAAASGFPVLVGGSRTGTAVGAAMLVARPRRPSAAVRVQTPPALAGSLTRYARAWRAAVRAHTGV